MEDPNPKSARALGEFGWSGFVNNRVSLMDWNILKVCMLCYYLTQKVKIGQLNNALIHIPRWLGGRCRDESEKLNFHRVRSLLSPPLRAIIRQTSPPFYSLPHDAPRAQDVAGCSSGTVASALLLSSRVCEKYLLFKVNSCFSLWRH